MKTATVTSLVLGLVEQKYRNISKYTNKTSVQGKTSANGEFGVEDPQLINIPYVKRFCEQLLDFADVFML